MSTVMNENQNTQEVLSESEYSGDAEEDKGDEVDEVVESIRSKYPHLSRKKVSALTKSWRGKKAAAIRRKAEQEELRQLRLIVSKRNKERFGASEAKAQAVSKDGGVRKANVQPKRPAVPAEKPPVNIFAAHF